MREIRTHGLKRGLPHRKHRGGMPYSTKESVRQRKRHADRKAGCAEGDRRAEAQPYKGMSQTKVKSRMYASKLLTERSPVVKRVMVAETNTDAADSFCAAPGGTGHRDMARSESSARELGRPVPRTMAGAMHRARPWEKLAAKADAGTRVRACEITEGHVRVEMRLREEMRGRRIGRGRRATCHVGRTRGIRI